MLFMTDKAIYSQQCKQTTRTNNQSNMVCSGYTTQSQHYANLAIFTFANFAASVPSVISTQPAQHLAQVPSSVSLSPITIHCSFTFSF